MSSLVKCPACGREVSRAAASCPQCAHPLQPASVQRKSSADGILKALLLIGVLYVAWRYWIPHEVRDGAQRLVTGGRQVIVDERIGVTSKTAAARGFTLSRPADIELSVDVFGDGINTYVVDEANWNKFKAGYEKIFGGSSFKHYDAFHREKIQKATMRGRLGPGTYVVVMENPTWGVMTKGSFDVQVKVTVNP